jgi:5-methylcytosine-specific restriction endonuclease McrA
LVCADKKEIRRRAREQEKKMSGICLTCSNPAAKDKIRCQDCLDRYREYANRVNKERLEQAKCVRCGISGVVNSRCEMCYLKDTSHEHLKTRKRGDELRVLFDKQNGVCPYTQKKMQLGIDSTLDHIVPLVLGGTNDIQNLQWVYRGKYDVNWIKGTMLEHDFKEAIKDLAMAMFSITIR